MDWFDINSTETKLAELSIKRVLAMSSDTHNIFTPFPLCKEIVGKIPVLAGKVLIVANLEFVYTLKQRSIDLSQIYFATPCPIKAKAAESILLRQNIFIYKTVIEEKDVNGMKFDVIVGNPPYQENMDDGSRKSKNVNLWSKFIAQAFDTLVVDSGYVAFITPPSWMSPNSKVLHYFLENQVEYLNVGECKKYFPTIGSQFSWYVIQKRSPYALTEVVCQYKNEVNLSYIDLTTEVTYLPMWITQQTIDILTKTIFSAESHIPVQIINELHTSRHVGVVNKEQTPNFPYPAFNTGTDIWYVSKQSSNYLLKKVLFGLPGNISPVYDNGNLSTTSNGAFVVVSSLEEGNNLITVLTSRLYKFITSISKWNGFNAPKVIQRLPAVDLSHSWTDQELYKHFNLTKDEIKLIEETIK